MNDFSLIEKFDILMNLISSSTLFLICSIIVIALLIFFIVCIILNKKINKTIFIIISSLIGLIFVINYGSIVLKILDSIIDSVFMALYFPSLPIYMFVLITSNIMFIISIFSKNFKKSKKIINIINSILLDFLLILIIDIVSKNNINIYEQVTLYTNTSLLVLLELSMGIFVSCILINLIQNAHEKLKKYDKEEIKVLPEIIFDD